MRPGMSRVVLTRDHTVLPATHTFIHEWNEPSCFYSVSIHHMAPPERGSIHCSLTLIYRPRKDKRLSGPSWLTCSERFTHISGHPSVAGQGKFASPRPTFCHCANAQWQNVGLWLAKFASRIFFNMRNNSETVSVFYLIGVAKGGGHCGWALPPLGLKATNRPCWTI